MVIKVAVVEDQREIREGLRALIDGSPGFRCTGSFRSLEKALPQIGSEVPHIVLVDIGLPGMSGIEGLPILKERYPDTLMLMLTVYEDEDRVFRALCAGASGYLLKNTAPAKLLESLQEAVHGGAPMSPEVAGRVIKLFRHVRPPEQTACELTPHEVRLLGLLADGYNYKTAAAALGVSVNTISFHMKQIYEKLHVHSKSHAVAKGFRQRIIR